MPTVVDTELRARVQRLLDVPLDWSEAAAVLAQVRARGLALARAGGDAEAVAASELAAALCRAHGSALELAQILDELGLRLTALYRYADAAAAAAEAVALYRREGLELPRGILVEALDRLASWRFLADQEPEHLGELASLAQLLREAEVAQRYRDKRIEVLGKLAERTSRARRFDEAVEYGRELIATLRSAPMSSMTSMTSSEQRAALAKALTNVSVDLSQLERHAEALAASEEAVSSLRTLAEAALPEHRLALVRALTNLAEDLDALGRSEETQALRREALGHRRALVEATEDPDDRLELLPELVSALGDLALEACERGEHDDARSLALEAEDHARALSQEASEVFAPELAWALDVRGVVERARGDHRASLALLCEGLALLLPRAGVDPGEHAELAAELGADIRETCAAGALALPEGLP
ncbi:tetratricopeptide repeat protein [Pseudenhygromyxa sp. WMMC2535]|uniref:tetratricopeptide repeat protein n=1 Tax=Pseudenhygromyxa sp. WMMC2535 TaxID=2712867 RepID=UPI001557B023|nr:tetratricopeptide repeat protein [Pseudenhygromyxa sp. WMMC2535]NVB38352.1 tetratricopeptide repeat protein [Pseudenhygromyxa sp. WMMC2535]